jgi:hypothetical protein
MCTIQATTFSDIHSGYAGLKNQFGMAQDTPLTTVTILGHNVDLYIASIGKFASVAGYFEIPHKKLGLFSCTLPGLALPSAHVAWSILAAGIAMAGAPAARHVSAAPICTEVPVGTQVVAPRHIPPGGTETVRLEPPLWLRQQGMWLHITFHVMSANEWPDILAVQAYRSTMAIPALKIKVGSPLHGTTTFPVTEGLTDALHWGTSGQVANSYVTYDFTNKGKPQVAGGQSWVSVSLTIKVGMALCHAATATFTHRITAAGVTLTVPMTWRMVQQGLGTLAVSSPD